MPELDEKDKKDRRDWRMERQRRPETFRRSKFEQKGTKITKMKKVVDTLWHAVLAQFCRP